MITEEMLMECNVFGKRLQLLRLQQEDNSPYLFAETLEITYDELAMLENGKMLPAFETLLILHGVFHINIDDILKETIQELENNKCILN